MNLIEGLQEEINRNKELLKEYEAIIQEAFVAIAIKQDIKTAEEHLTKLDIIEMMRSYGTLKGNK